MIDKFIGQTLANKYRLDSILREGDLGNTYLGMHTAMEKPVTVKVLAPALAVDENIVRRFSAEARTASNISHPNILNVTDFGKDNNGAVYIVYEGAEGTTLKNEINTVGQFSPERAVAIARQIASALSSAHANKTIHGSLSSANILLAHSPNNSEIVKVLDFGAVKLTNEIALDDEVIDQNVEYLSPEQCTNAGEADARSDIYTLGVILYEMLAGEVPFSGNTPTEIMLKHAEEPPPPLSSFRQDLPVSIEPVVLQAMAKNPEMRYQTADDLIADLQNADRLDTFAAPQTAEATASTNNIWKTAFVVLAGISLLAITLIYATSSKQTDPTTAMQTDANGQPVQPINPATGADEQSLSNMSAMSAEIIGNSNSMPLPPGTISGDGGGDGYNPWANGVQPPPGAPMYIPQQQGGQYITIDPNNPSQFIPTDGPNGVILVPVPANTAVNANIKPTPTPKTNNANANVAPTPQANASPTPNAPKPTPTPKATVTPAKPAAKPSETPKPTTPPASTEKRGQSGKEQDTN
jgi:serine/threonine protein kinase